MELWKDIYYIDTITKEVVDYRGKYQISNTGKVKSIKNNKILKNCLSTHGYLRVNLYKNGSCKEFKIHRLVGHMFVDNNNNYQEINHLDEDKTNNHYTNLQWVTRQENVNYGERNEKSAKKIRKKVICINTGIVYDSTLDAQEKTGISSQTISSCCLFHDVNCNKDEWFKTHKGNPRKTAGKHPITKEKLVWKFYKGE